MTRTLCTWLVAAAFLISSTSGAMASSWRHMYSTAHDPLYGLLEENEMASMAYLKVPFGGPVSKRNEARWGISLMSRMPYEMSHVRLGNRRGIATLVDLQFDGRKMRDLQMNGLSMRQSFNQLNAIGDGGQSAWITYGLMALAVGAGAAVIVFATGDSDNEIPRTPGRAQGPGCGDGMGPGNGDGQGPGNMGGDDPRRNPATGACTAGSGPGNGDGMGPGAGDGTGDGNMGNGSM